MGRGTERTLDRPLPLSQPLPRRRVSPEAALPDPRDPSAPCVPGHMVRPERRGSAMRPNAPIGSANEERLLM